MRSLKTKKPTILLVHGGPGLDDSYFFPYLNPLKEDFRLRSYLQRRGATLAGLCRELAQQISQLSAPRYILAHSWGTGLLLETLKRHPQLKLHGVVLVSAMIDKSLNAQYQAHLKFWKRRNYRVRVKNRNDEFKKSTIDALELFFTKRFYKTGKQILQKIKYDKMSVDRIHWPRYLKTFDLRMPARALDAPILNIFGGCDYRIPKAHSRKLKRLNKRVSNFEIRGAGHFCFVEQPKAFSQRTLAFLRRLTRQTS